MKVGFIGLGVMGAPMAANILKGGHELTVYDRSAEAVARLVQAGAKAAANPREVGAASEIVVTMLPEPQLVVGLLDQRRRAAEGVLDRCPLQLLGNDFVVGHEFGSLQNGARVGLGRPGDRKSVV